MIKHLTPTTLILCTLLSLQLSPAAHAVSIFIQPQSEATSKDTKVYTHVPTGNFSSNLSITHPDTGAHFSSLVQFDLTALAGVTSAQVLETGAYLMLYVTGVTTPGSVGVAAILDPWVETGAEVGPGTPPLATFNALFGVEADEIEPTITWGSTLDTEAITGTGWYKWDITSTVLQWMDGTLDNNGLYIYTTTSLADIGIADVNTPANGVQTDPPAAGFGPALAVPEPSRMLLLGLGLGSLLFRRTRRSNSAGALPCAA